MKNIFNLKKSMPAKAVEEHMMGTPDDERTAKAKEDVAFLSDIALRMLANRDLVVCLNVCATVLNSIALHSPEQGRHYIASCLEDLADSIRDMTDAEPPAVN